MRTDGVLITGGAGSLGSEVVKMLHRQDPKRRLVVYSRDEGKHQALRREVPEGGSAGVRYMIGDIRDTDRLAMAMTGCTYMIHAAAMKMIDTCEYEAWEATDINVNGTISVAKACLRAGVKHAVYVGTDKCPDPVSTYGRTKGLAEDVWIHSNTYGPCTFDAVRYGNVIGSNKSMFHHWKQLRLQGKPIPVTHPDATRFYWTIDAAAKFVVRVLSADSGRRGCVYIPKMKSYRIMDIARLYGEPEIVGWRCPEKVHECLWTDHESTYTRNEGDYYVLYPETHPWQGDMQMPGAAVRPVTSTDTLSDLKADYGII